MKRRRKRSMAAAVALGLALAGCGSDDELLPPAEPGTAPSATRPAGQVIELGAGEAEGIVADPRTGIVVVGTRDPDRAVLVSRADGPRPRIRRIRIPESPRHMQLAGPGGPALATAERSDDLVRISLPEGKVSSVRVGDFPHDAAKAPNGRVFVADEGGDTISVVEGEEVVETLPAPIQPGGVAVLRDGLVGVVAVAERVIRIYDAETLEVLGQTELGIGPTHIVAGADDRFYVADTEGDAILVVRADPKPVIVDRLNLPGKPYGLAIDNRASRLWVTLTERNQLIELELGERAPKRLRELPTIQQANTVAVDPARGLLYVAGRVNGELQVIDTAEAPGS